MIAMARGRQQPCEQRMLMSSGINEFGVLAVERETGGGSVEDVETVSP